MSFRRSRASADRVAALIDESGEDLHGNMSGGPEIYEGDTIPALPAVIPDNFDEAKYQAGMPRHVRAVISAMASSYAPYALREMARLAFHSRDEKVRYFASKEILDRAVGKPKQMLVGGDDGDTPLIPPPLTITYVHALPAPPDDDGDDGAESEG